MELKGRTRNNSSHPIGSLRGRSLVSSVVHRFNLRRFAWNKLLHSASIITLTASVVTTLVSIAASQIFLFISGILFSLDWLKDRYRIIVPPILLPLTAFAATTFLSLAASPDRTQGTASIRKLILFCMILLVGNIFRLSKHVSTTFAGLAVVSSLASLLGFYQLFRNLLNVQKMTEMHRLEIPEAYGYFIYGERMTGFMSHWMTFSGEQMLVFSMITGLLLFSNYGQRKFWRVCHLLIGLSIIFSAVRGVWLGVGVAVTYLIFLKAKKWLLVFPLLLLALYLFLPQVVLYRAKVTLDFRNENRLFQWRTGWNMIKAHPWFGVGPNRIASAYDQYKPEEEPSPAGWHGHLHNNFIQLAAERGIPCMLAWTWLMWRWGWQLFRAGRGENAGLRRAACLGGSACVLALVTAGLFEFNFGDSEVLMLFLFFVTAPFVLVRSHSKTPANRMIRTKP